MELSISTRTAKMKLTLTIKCTPKAIRYLNRLFFCFVKTKKNCNHSHHFKLSMNTAPNPADFNKSAYVALICLIAFVIVITICVIKQFIWDPLLAPGFETLRPVLSESVRRFSSTFYRPQSTRTSFISLQESLSDAGVLTNDSAFSAAQPPIIVTQSLPANNAQQNPIKRKLPPRSYGSSSSNPFTYINYGSEDISDEELKTPLLHISCEYDPSAFNIKINIQHLRHMNIFQSAINSRASILIRFILSGNKPSKSYETSPQTYEDFIRFNETFIVLNNIQSGDTVSYQIKFLIVLLINEKSYEIAEGIHSFKDDCLTYVLFVERTLVMDLKFIQNERK